MLFLLFKFQLGLSYFLHLEVFHFAICWLQFVNNFVGNAFMLIFFREQICVLGKFRIFSSNWLDICLKRLVSLNLFLEIFIKQGKILQEVIFDIFNSIYPLKRSLISKSLKIDSKKVV